MMKKIIVRKVIYTTWLSVALSLCWPLPPRSSRNQIFVYQVLQILAIISILLVLLPLLYTTYLHLDNIVVVCQSICLAIGMCQSISQTIICLVKHSNLQHIVGELMTCIEEAKQYEKEILQKCISKFDTFYKYSTIIMYTTASGVLLGPIVISTPFPYDVTYPFNTNYTLTYTVLYFHQCVITYQCTAHICLSRFGGLLLWITAARFECLAVEFQKCSDVNMMVACIKKQLKLRRRVIYLGKLYRIRLTINALNDTRAIMVIALMVFRYAENVTDCFRFMVLYAIAVSIFSMTICGLLLTTNLTSFVVKLQFIFVCCTVLTEIYMYAWPADYMMDMSVNVSRSVYDLSWYEHTLEMQKYLLNVLVYQKPTILSVANVLPELSLRYFCTYLTNAFSIFTTMRAVVGDMD